MKQFRLFFAAAALLLVTAGVFAKSSKFITPGLYLDNGGVKFRIDNATSWPGLTTTASGNQAKIINSSTPSTSFLLFESSDGTNFTAVYANGF